MSIERDVAEWALDNATTLVSMIITSRVDIPGNGVFKEEYNNGVLSLIRTKASQDLQMNAEDLLVIIDEDFIRKLIPNIFDI